MDFDEAIGARLAVGVPGPDATADVARQLRRTKAQSLVVFARNFTGPEQFLELLRRLDAAAGHRLLVLVDHEGGRIIRFTSGVTRFPDALAAGRAGAAAIESQGRAEAEELRRLKVHGNLAPCVDVLLPGSDPVIGDRSYGEDPVHVGACGVARIRGLQAGGVAACAKHFPGLGAVPRDPHRILPTIALSWDEMEEVHLPPFQEAMAAGAAMVMSSHVCYPGLGEPPDLPATFSPRLIRGLLRERFQYEGVIVTDDLEMGALRTFGSVAEAAIRATDAGHDLLLICSDLQAAEETLTSLRAAYQSSRLSQDELQLSVNRLQRLRQTYLR